MVRRRLNACVFCGASGAKMSREDVIPRWVRRVLGITGPVRMTRGRTGEVIRTDETLVLVVRGAVCIVCNTGWMHDLEERVRPLISDALTAQIIALSPNGQRSVATWAVKTALLLELALKEARGFGYAPESNFRWLYQHRGEDEPPPGAYVSLGAVDAENSLPSWSIAGWWGDRLEEPEIYIGTFSIGYLLVQVVGQDFRPADLLSRSGQPLARFEAEPRYRPYFLPIWPDPRPVVAWPPARRFSLQDLGGLGDRSGARLLRRYFVRQPGALPVLPDMRRT